MIWCSHCAKGQKVIWKNMKCVVISSILTDHRLKCGTTMIPDLYFLYRLRGGTTVNNIPTLNGVKGLMFETHTRRLTQSLVWCVQVWQEAELLSKALIFSFHDYLYHFLSICNTMNIFEDKVLVQLLFLRVWTFIINDDTNYWIGTVGWDWD